MDFLQLTIDGIFHGISHPATGDIPTPGGSGLGPAQCHWRLLEKKSVDQSCCQTRLRISSTYAMGIA